MKMANLLFCALLICALSTGAASAQTSPVPVPHAYYIAEFEPTVPDAIKPYSAQVASTFEPFGGRFIVRGGRAEFLEGAPSKGRIVIIQFDSLEKAQAWYDLPAYTALREIRYKAGISRVFILEGLNPQGAAQ
ncbi:DUF1330 domain-containing protein [Asticcacaulis sp. ZE23SCel15]|uniref:DUF1330 domain-containing protein n=1 Tax=Asticcacaulis sp. ZE23SCel15 TaxID=3059027 RepID=UPI00265F6C51|nr:DUF1330 domain-containing protein [Asticcacaulis sp. ZE23SCel15]WKL56703.1 DUF1330 domain-containing protein [Asticcacaulis sp. ZE23SCel15]